MRTPAGRRTPLSFSDGLDLLEDFGPTRSAPVRARVSIQPFKFLFPTSSRSKVGDQIDFFENFSPTRVRLVGARVPHQPTKFHRHTRPAVQKLLTTVTFRYHSV